MNNTSHPFAHHHLIWRDEIIFLLMISQILGVNIAKNMNILAIKLIHTLAAKRTAAAT